MVNYAVDVNVITTMIRYNIALEKRDFQIDIFIISSRNICCHYGASAIAFKISIC